MGTRSRMIAATVMLSAGLLAPGAMADTSWQPGSTPNAPTYVVLESEPGDWIGQGRTYSYTEATATMSVSGPEGSRLLSVDVDGDETWTGRFEVPAGAPLDETLYDGATRYPFNSDDTPGLSWTGEGRGCNTSTGWFWVDGFAHDTDGTLSFLLLRFEQHCDNSSGVLHGAVRYDAAGTPPPPPNPQPDPGDRWTPDRSLLPADATPVVLLDSSTGDWVGQGGQHLYSGYDVVSTATLPDGVGISVDDGMTGDWWNGTFVGPDGAGQLEVGLYDDLQRHPFHNPVLGGLSWSGNGRGCNELTGWFIVDEVSYTPNGLVGLSLRFEQHCDASTAPLRGLIEFGIDRTPPDTTPPIITSLTGPADRTKSTTATFTFTASEAATFTCSLDGAPATSCSSPATEAGLSRGSHTFTVVATDLAGNVSQPATWSWSIKGGKGGKPRR